MSLPERIFRNGQEPAISEVIMNEIYSNIREDQEKIEEHETKIAEIDGNLPFPFAVQNGKYGYIKKVAGADTFCPFNDMLYIVTDKIKNEILISDYILCTKSTDSYYVDIIGSYYENKDFIDY